MTSSAADWTAIVLSGGGGRRLGGTDKAVIELAQRSTIDRIIGDLPTSVDVIVAGPPCPTARPVHFVQEDPPDGGPVAGIAAALECVPTELLAIVAVDMPLGGRALPRLVQHVRDGDVDAAIAVDSTGRRQPLCAAWRTPALHAAVERLAGGRDRAVHALLDDVRIETVPLDDRLLVDIDTTEDLQRARTLIVMSDDAVMQRWIDAVTAELGITADVDVSALLDVARVAAHGVARPAAPVTTYLLGLAVADGADPSAAAAAIAALADNWAPAEPA